MDEATRQTCYEGITVQNFKFFKEHSREHEVILQHVKNILHQEFNRAGLDKSSLDVLGVGSGGGQMDAGMLTELQSTLPDVPIAVEIVEGSHELTDCFKALVAKTPNLQKIPFVWHTMRSEEYMSQVKAKGHMKKFDFIHMIHMIYYVDDLTDTIKFYHSLLKDNGRLLIVLLGRGAGQSILWRTYRKELCNDAIKELRTSDEVISCLKSLGLKYEDHHIPNTFDITECFSPDSQTGKHLLSFITARHDFHQSFTPEIRAGMLDLLRTKCCSEKDGKVFFSHDQRCIVIYP